MRISAKARYACLALIDIAQAEPDGLRRRVREIADAQAIPPRYLPHILIRLKTAGFVQSARGPDGGYQLALSAANIAVGDVIAAIDGRRDQRLAGDSVAARNLSELLVRVECVEQRILREATIAQLARQAGTGSWVI
jgi:Rrf2 family protein